MIRVAFISVFVLFSAFSYSGFAASIGKVVAIVGAPSASGPGGSRNLAAGSEVFEKDKITVGGGNAQILFVDGTRLVIGPGSTLVVEKFLLRGGSSAQKFSINALRGTYRFITGKSAKSAYNIKTANATIGIRGTGFDFWVKGDTGLAVHQGKVKLCNMNGSCVDLNAGCDLGIAKRPGSEKITGTNKVANVTSKLPYILNQSSLNSRFRLNVQACAAVISKSKRGPNLNDENQGRTGNTNPRDPKTPRSPNTPPPPNTPPDNGCNGQVC
jgi:hypothetical protein